MPIVATLIRNSVTMKILRRPQRSPSEPKMKPPIGRTTKATPIDETASRTAMAGLSGGKKLSDR